MRTTPAADRPRLMIHLLADVPNFITLVGFCLSLLAMFFALKHAFELALISALWAVVADWIDGWLAACIKSRPKEREEFGANLDSFADLISSGIFPAILLMAVGNLSMTAILCALFVASAGVLRLSYFNVYGATEDGKVVGLPIAHNILVLTLLFLLRPFIRTEQFFPILAATNSGLGILNIAPFFFPRGRAAVIPWITGFAALSTVALLSMLD
ncbi:CDP-alcohol phosphatidyltransferase family protein [Bradyrhizobium sp. 33ap4]|uniref:CDP-alcohol phosphatidyltransferase family protein n=1 Tax=Bradyrhizobium sp. 33ap4 TaxID=3061630 RepID=UPI00292EBD45|nr:CDP-alcohol phosphatidyltransferase family protein [Bradyrhizobium sp. 33ap4]